MTTPRIWIVLAVSLLALSVVIFGALWLRTHNEIRAHEADWYSASADMWRMSLDDQPLDVSAARWQDLKRAAGPLFSRIGLEEQRYIWFLVNAYVVDDRLSDAFAIAQTEVRRDSADIVDVRNTRLAIYLAVRCGRREWLTEFQGATTSGNSAMKLFVKASVALESGQNTKVLDILSSQARNEAVAREPSALAWDWWLVWLRVLALERLGRYEEAMEETGNLALGMPTLVRGEETIFVHYMIEMARLGRKAGRQEVTQECMKALKEMEPRRPKRYRNAVKVVHELVGEETKSE